MHHPGARLRQERVEEETVGCGHPHRGGGEASPLSMGRRHPIHYRNGISMALYLYLDGTGLEGWMVVALVFWLPGDADQSALATSLTSIRARAKEHWVLWDKLH